MFEQFTIHCFIVNRDYYVEEGALFEPINMLCFNCLLLSKNAKKIYFQRKLNIQFNSSNQRTTQRYTTKMSDSGLIFLTQNSFWWVSFSAYWFRITTRARCKERTGRFRRNNQQYDESNTAISQHRCVIKISSDRKVQERNETRPKPENTKHLLIGVLKCGMNMQKEGTHYLLTKMISSSLLPLQQAN